MKHQFKIKRIYEPAAKDDGLRVLVDRLWPRGVSKQIAAVDIWFKDIAPTPELRTWFNHEAERFAEFSARYTNELQQNPAVKQLLEEAAKHGTTTLLYAAHDEKVNHAVVLLQYLTDEQAPK